MKALKKPFEAPQRSMKIKIEVNFSFLAGIETFWVNIYFFRKPLTIFAKSSTIDFWQGDKYAKLHLQY